MSEDLDKSDIDLALFGITYMEYCIMNNRSRNKDSDPLLVKAILVKQKLYRMKDGIDIQKYLNEEQNGKTDEEKI